MHTLKVGLTWFPGIFIRGPRGGDPKCHVPVFCIGDDEISWFVFSVAYTFQFFIERFHVCSVENERKGYLTSGWHTSADEMQSGQIRVLWLQKSRFGVIN